MSQSPCLYVVNKTHPKYEELLGEIDWILNDEYADLIEARLQSMRGMTTVMYLGDRFEPHQLNALVGDWETVKKQIESDMTCFLEGKLPDDLPESSLTATIQPYHGGTAAFQRRNEHGELDLVKLLNEFIQEVNDSKAPASDLMVVRSWW